MSVLTAELIFQKTKCSTLEEVKMLNIWGSRVRDVSILERMPNVEVLSLTMNQISSIEPFTKCPKLKELYLRKNEIQSLDGLDVLSRSCPQLRVLWLCDNPCAKPPSYRSDVIRLVPQLTTLDNEAITASQRAEAGRPSDARSPSSGGRDSPRSLPPRTPSPSLDVLAPSPRSTPIQPVPAPAPAPAPPQPQLQPQPQPLSQAPPHRADDSSRSSNVLYAVLTLLKELNSEEKQIVLRELLR
eukprot:ANDGO_01776.mRNA.1 Uncharacterized protein F09G8.5